VSAYSQGLMEPKMKLNKCETKQTIANHSTARLHTLKLH